MSNSNEMDLNQLGQLKNIALQNEEQQLGSDELQGALAEALGTDLTALAPQGQPAPTLTASTESAPKANPALEVANATLDPKLASQPVVTTQAPQEEEEVVTQTTAEVTEEDAARHETPELEATVAETRDAAIKNGDIVQDVNPLLNEMRKLGSEMNKNNDIAEKTRKILENAVIDLNNITIVTDNETDPLEMSAQLQMIEASRPKVVTPIIALKSGYKADMLALTSMDKIDMRNLQGTLMDQTIKMLRIVHRKVGETSVGKLKFEDWLAITAEEDYDTILFGLYSSTFPKATEYTVTCGHCKTKNNLNLFPSHLLEVVDRDNASKYVQEVLEGWNRGKDFLAESLVAKTSRIMLPKSRFVIDLCTPTLRNMLDNLTVMERMKQHPGEIVSLLKYIRGFNIPNIQALAQGKVVYHAVGNQLDRLTHITKLEAEDLSYLRKEIGKRITSNMVTYQIPSFQCANQSDCGKEIKNTTVDLTQLLFIAIREED